LELLLFLLQAKVMPGLPNIWELWNMQRLNWNTQQLLWGVIAVCCRNNVYVSSTYNTCNNSLDVLKEWREVFPTGRHVSHSNSGNNLPCYLYFYCLGCVNELCVHRKTS
jgi:hypothetical protein